MFLKYVHAMRGLAISLVVLAHAKLAVDWAVPPGLNERLLKAFLEGSTVPFFFIAGYLFQSRIHKFEYGPYLRGKARYVLVPYLVCSAPIMVHAFVFRWGIFEGANQTPLDQLGIVAHSLLTARHMFVPYWFLPTLGVMYLLAPLLVAFDRRPVLYWTLPLWIGMGALIHLSPLYQNVLQNAACMLPSYLLGMAVSHHGDRARELMRRYRHLLLGSSLAIAGLSVALSQTDRLTSARPFGTETGIIDYALLQKTALTLWLFDLLAHLDESGRFDASRIYAWTARIADLSFGIFFLHIYVLTFVYRPTLQRVFGVPDAGWLPIFGITAAYYGATLVLVVIAKRLTGRYSRYLIGC